jgi:hypothetical protein
MQEGYMCGNTCNKLGVGESEAHFLSERDDFPECNPETKQHKRIALKYGQGVFVQGLENRPTDTCRNAMLVQKRDNLEQLG